MGSSLLRGVARYCWSLWRGNFGDLRLILNVVNNCQKRQTTHFDREAFLFLFPNFHFCKFLFFPTGFKNQCNDAEMCEWEGKHLHRDGKCVDKVKDFSIFQNVL